MIVERLLPPEAAAGLRAERVTLASADLQRHRQRVRTDAGRELGIDLPHGSHLHDGDVLHVAEGVAVVVVQAEEDLLTLRPRTPREFATAGYQVGNLHRAAMIDEAGVSVLYDKAVEALAGRFGIPCERRRGKFVPAQSSGHAH
ncbi:MAG TPA: urease accessory protein UreE [Planctomycetota bacterium]